jgi:ubiquinone/menaquinone biosynthesis C-methylase UbiE
VRRFHLYPDPTTLSGIEMRTRESEQSQTPREQAHDPTEKPSLYDRLHLKMISLVHDTLYGWFVDPYVWLDSAGLKKGMTVLEVGCGPGFFTVPAAKIVGTSGCLYTLDINPAAVQRVRRKAQLSGLMNIETFQADACKTGLPDQSIDLAFLFGILHALKDLDTILLEMNRVLKNDGILSVQISRQSEQSLLSSFTKQGLFSFVGKTSSIYRFKKWEVRMKP